MVQSPSLEANWFAASKEISRISRNPKVHYRTHKRPPPVSILGQPNPVHIPTSHLLEIHPNIIHPSTPRSPRWSLSLRFPQQDPIVINTNNKPRLQRENVCSWDDSKKCKWQLMVDGGYHLEKTFQWLRQMGEKGKSSHIHNFRAST